MAWKEIRANIDDFQFKEAITHARICSDPLLDERLRSRYSCGVIVKIEKPDYETRCAILYEKSLDLQEKGFPQIKKEVLQYIAERDLDIRTLEGALKCFLNHADVQCESGQVEVDVSLAEQLLKDVL